MSREREIEQGLRHPDGGLIGGLNVLDYWRGIQDYESETPPPSGLTSTSYDLGRTRAQEKAERADEAMAWLEREQEAGRQRVREALRDRPDILAEYDAKMAERRPSG